jgi:hypothetical protein
MSDQRPKRETMSIEEATVKAETTSMTWMPEKPTAPGWYWFRVKDTDVPYPVKVYAVGHILYAWPLGDETMTPISQRLEHYHGQFLCPPRAYPKG